MTPTRLDIMRALAARPGSTMPEVALAVGIGSSLVDRLWVCDELESLVDGCLATDAYSDGHSRYVLTSAGIKLLASEVGDQ